MQTLFDFGLIEYADIQALIHLKTLDYITGPEAYRDVTTGQKCKFLHSVSRETIFLKLKFFQHSETIVCILKIYTIVFILISCQYKYNDFIQFFILCQKEFEH